MKSLFFFANIYETNTSIGITNKVKQQMNAFRVAGYENIYHSAYLEDGVAIFDNENNIILFKKYRFKGKLNSVTKNYDLKRVVRDFFKSGDYTFDLVYARYVFFDPYFLSLLKVSKKYSDKIIIEAHSYPIYEKGNYALYPIYLIDYLFTFPSRKYIDLVAGISERKNIWGIKTVTIDNGIDINEYKLKPYDDGYKEEINFIFVGFEYSVHGLDRFLKGMYNYNQEENKTKVKLHLVGRIMNSTLKLIDELKLNNYVILEGILQGEELDKVFLTCNVAIGTLAPHRRNSTIGSGLKSKEYMARGIPFCIAGECIELPDEYPFIFKCNLNDADIDINELLKFYGSVNKIKNYNIEMREFAKELSWDKQIMKVLNSL